MAVSTKQKMRKNTTLRNLGIVPTSRSVCFLSPYINLNSFCLPEIVLTVFRGRSTLIVRSSLSSR